MKDERKTKARLIEELEILRRRVAVLDGSPEPVPARENIAGRKQVEEALCDTGHLLDARNKELNCLFGISSLAANGNLTLEEMLQEIVKIIPPAWQYPDVACARILLEDLEYKTGNFTETQWRQFSDLMVHGRRAGTVEICYIEARQPCDEGPFLRNERMLLNAIAERVGRIVERMKAEESLRESESSLSMTLKSIGDGLIATDSSGRITRINPVAEYLTGWKAEEALGRPSGEVFRIINEFTRENVQNPIERVLKEGRIVGLANHTVLIARDGTERPIADSGAPIRLEEGGEVLGAVLVFRDQTRERQAEEELKFRNLLLATQQEVSIDGILVVDGHDKILSYNSRFVDLWGIPPEVVATKSDELALKSVLDKLADPGKFLEKVQYLYEHREENSRDEIVLADGRIFDRYSAPMIGAASKYYGRIWYFRDISAQKRTEEAIRESELKFRTITESALDAIIMMDNAGMVTFWNPAAEKIFGYSKEELLGKDVHMVLSPAHYLDSFQKAFSKWRETGEGPAIGKVVELQALRAGGKEISVELSLSSVNLGEKWSAVGIIRDITERKKAEENLLEANRQLEAATAQATLANRAKSEFLANMSHEIRTPLNAVIGFTELLKGRITDEKSRNYLEGIVTGGRNLLNLINDILDLSKIEAGRMEIHPEVVNPQSLYEEMAQIFSVRMNEKGLYLRIEISPSLSQALLLDETRLRQILLNLVGNSVKFTEKGGITMRMRTVPRALDGSVVDLLLEVEDTGIGIPAEQQNQIFEAFRQQEGQSTRKYGGTGLGLTITKHLVAIMGGNISLESEPGKGSIFRVLLPGIRVTALVAGGNEEGDEIFESVIFQGSTVLMVEDIESNRQVIAGLLDPYHLVVAEAVNGLEGIDMARIVHPDLILMDMQMPVMDGYEATRRIKADPDLKHIPVVALTASALKEDARSILELCDGYLRKPVSKRILLRELARFLPHTFREEAVTPAAAGWHDLPAVGETDRELAGVLSEKFFPRWKEVRAGMVMEEISDFSRDLRDLGVKHASAILEKYGDELLRHAESFRIEPLTRMLSQFPLLLEKLAGNTGGSEHSTEEVTS